MTIDQPRVPGIAGRSAAIGGGLGIAAGVAQTTIGRHIPDWSGNKAQPVALGLLTIALSASALATAGTLRATTKPGDGALTSIAIWLAAVAAVCASTVGRLWVIPGVLLLVAAGVTIAACGVRNVRAVVARNWLVGLLGVLGVFELVMAVSAPSVVTRVAGLLAGAALIAAALTATPGRRTLIAVLVAATLPFVALTWWTIVTPAVTVVAFAIGAAATSNRAHAAAPRLEWGPVRAADR